MQDDKRKEFESLLARQNMALLRSMFEESNDFAYAELNSAREALIDFALREEESDGAGECDKKPINTSKHIFNKCPEDSQSFLESVYDDLMGLHDDGVNSALVKIVGVLHVNVTDEGGRVNDESDVSIEISVANIESKLNDEVAVVLGSLIGSLLDENHLREFDYSISPL